VVLEPLIPATRQHLVVLVVAADMTLPLLAPLVPLVRDMLAGQALGAIAVLVAVVAAQVAQVITQLAEILPLLLVMEGLASTGNHWVLTMQEEVVVEPPLGLRAERPQALEG
jgi:hypothetical protein